MTYFQRKRFEMGRPLSVEEYLERVAGLQDERDALLALITREHEARASWDTAPELAEWTRCFPELADEQVLAGRYRVRRRDAPDEV